VESDVVAVASGATLADVMREVRAIHADRPKLVDVLAVCSTLVGDRPVGTRAPSDVPLRPGDVVELLPPFAGG
jgi:molybdopterin converting factor small subunit